MTETPTGRRVYCWRCNRLGIETYLRKGVEMYKSHDHVAGGDTPCRNSRKPVQETR